jgi:hypothetical protein
MYKDNDRELLKLAAKAAGYYFHGLRIGKDYLNCYVSKTGDSDDWFVWSPLTDDGDALRLAVKLGLQLRRHYYEGEYFVDSMLQWRVGGVTYSEPIASDPYAATRRAIVRAAAALYHAA